MSNSNSKADFYFAKETRWQKAIQNLRSILLSCGLTETLKWGVPCYTFENKNIVLIHVFKDYCALLYIKGVLLQDAEGLLIQQTKNVQSARQLRFQNVAQIAPLEPMIKRYTYEAIEVEKKGLKVAFKSPEAFEMTEEFQNKLAESSALNAAFESLTPGRQRAYLLYFAAAKQAKTREDRIEKYRKSILEGKGLND